MPQATQALLNGNHFLSLLAHIFVLDDLDFSCTSRTSALRPCPRHSTRCLSPSWLQLSPSQHALSCFWYLSHPIHLWRPYVLPHKCPFSLFIKHILVTSLNVVPIMRFYNRNRMLIPNRYFQTSIISPLFYCEVCCFLMLFLRGRACNASQNTSLCSKEREGVTNHSSNSKLINASLYPTFTERLPVGEKINGQFNTYSSFLFLRKNYILLGIESHCL